MANLSNPKNTIEIINKYGFTIQKKYGQNFLVDSHVLEKIIRAADINENDFIIEIGPGIGTLTQYLCEYGGSVLAVEIDKKLIPILEETLADYNNVEVLNEDILKLNLQEIIEEKSRGQNIKVVANLPYYITTPIIMMLLESKLPIKNITVMVQKEVAQRIQSGPGTKDYGSISLAVGYYAKAYIAANVPPNCFIPRPKVGSAVISLTPYTKPPVEVKDEELFFQIIRSSFNQRRKTLTNGLYNGGFIELSKDEIADSISLLGKPTNIRGEALTLDEFAKLSNIIHDKTNK